MPAGSGRVAAGRVAGALLLGLLLTGCGVETVESNIADQQRCVAAQAALAEAPDAAGVGAVGDRVAVELRRLASGVRDEGLRSALEAAADGAGAGDAERLARAGDAVDLACRRLQSF